MRKHLFIAALALALSASIHAAETYDEYVAVMKAGAGANGKMRKMLESDLKGAAAAAEEAKAAFEEMEAYWKMKGADDAVTFSRNIVTALEQVHAAAAAGDKEKAMAAAQGIGANCGGCHNAHRDKDAAGKFVIK